MKTTLKKIADYLVLHPYLRLATVNTAGTPIVHTVGYVSEGATIYFTTDSESRKARNIAANPAVAYAVDENYTELMAIQGVQMEGTASLVADRDEVVRIGRLMVEKFPALQDMPQNPALVFFKVEPKQGYFIDCPVEFGHRDKVVY